MRIRNDVSDRFVTLPNVISMARIVSMAPLLLFLRADMFVSALVLFLASAASDVLDGAIARRWNMQSEFGRVLDPLADKVTFVTLIVVLSRHVLAVVPIMILVAAEIVLLTIGACRYMYPKWHPWIILGANIYGKIKTRCETLLVTLLIIQHLFAVPAWYPFVLYAVLTLCIVFALKSIMRHMHPKPLG